MARALIPPSCCVGRSGHKLLQPVNISFNINSKSLEIRPGSWLAAFWLCLGAQISSRTASKISPQLFNQGRAKRGEGGVRGRGKKRGNSTALLHCCIFPTFLYAGLIEVTGKIIVNLSKAFSVHTFL